MLTTIAAITAAVTSILNALVLLDVLDLTTEQITGITLAVTAVGAVVHTLFNPDVPVGVTKPPSP